MGDLPSKGRTRKPVRPAKAPAESLSPRRARVGGVAVDAGTRASIRIGESSGDDTAVPACVLVGAAAGPRLSLLGAPQGFETAAAFAVEELCRSLNPRTLTGTVVAVPVFRPGGKLGRRVRPLVPIGFPGDAAGGRQARLALALHGALVSGSDVVVVLGAPRPGRAIPLVVRGDMSDPRVHRLARASGAIVADGDVQADEFLAHARGAGVAALELRVGSADARADQMLLVRAIERILAALHMSVVPGVPPPGHEPLDLRRRVPVPSPAPGRLEHVVPPGRRIEKGKPLARLVPFDGADPLLVLAPVSGVVVQSPSRPLSPGAGPLFVVGVPRQDSAHLPPPPAALPPKLTAGWVERVSLPQLGLLQVQAKLDTGARTSALHVLGTTAVPPTPGKRATLKVVLPGRGPRTRRTLILRVREYVDVRDTSGRTERRPVVETELELGPLRRRIRLTLTNRGDMRHALLLGRTALGPDVLVDPGRRFVLDATDVVREGSARIPRNKNEREI